MPTKKFFITPNGNCSVFLSSHHPGTPQSARFAADAPPNLSTVESGWKRGSLAQPPEFPGIPEVGSTSASLGKLRKPHSEVVPERLRPHLERPLDKPPRLKPLLDRPLDKGSSTRKRLKTTLTDLAPWELAELEYVDALKRPSQSQQLCTALLERYCEPLKESVCSFSINNALSVVPDDAAVAARVPVKPGLAVETGDPCTPAAPTASAPTVLLPLPSAPSTPRTMDGGSRSSPASSPSKRMVFTRVTPLTLPGMKSVPPASNFLGGITRAITPVKMLDKLSSSTDLDVDAETPMSAPAPTTDAQRKSMANSNKTRWAVLSPFLSFLTRPRKSQTSEDEVNEHSGNNPSTYSAHASGRDGHQGDDSEASSSAMHAKTLGMPDSLQQWRSVSEKGDDAQRNKYDSALANEITSSGDKVEIRGLIALAKKYNLPVNDVREMKREFVEHDKESTGEISWEEFQGLIRKRGNLPADQEIPAHLLRGMSERQPKAMDGNGATRNVEFEEFLRWTIHTAWSEEMLMPCPEERKIRQMARDQCMLLPDVERVKQIFDEFDVDGSGEIEEEEFRHILYKMLQVRNITDVPIKRLKRYWREVDLDGSGSIGFNEFLIWYKTSFSKDGRIELG